MCDRPQYWKCDRKWLDIVHLLPRPGIGTGGDEGAEGAPAAGETAAGEEGAALEEAVVVVEEEEELDAEAAAAKANMERMLAATSGVEA